MSFWQHNFTKGDGCLKNSKVCRVICNYQNFQSRTNSLRIFLWVLCFASLSLSLYEDQMSFEHLEIQMLALTWTRLVLWLFPRVKIWNQIELNRLVSFSLLLSFLGVTKHQSNRHGTNNSTLAQYTHRSPNCLVICHPKSARGRDAVCSGLMYTC